MSETYSNLYLKDGCRDREKVEGARGSQKSFAKIPFGSMVGPKVPRLSLLGVSMVVVVKDDGSAVDATNTRIKLVTYLLLRVIRWRVYTS